MALRYRNISQSCFTCKEVVKGALDNLKVGVGSHDCVIANVQVMKLKQDRWPSRTSPCLVNLHDRRIQY